MEFSFVGRGDLEKIAKGPESAVGGGRSSASQMTRMIFPLCLNAVVLFGKAYYSAADDEGLRDAEGPGPRHLDLAERQPAADRQLLRGLWCHDFPRAAVVSALQRRGHERGVVAAPRHPRGMDHAGIPARPALCRPAGKDFVPFGMGLVQLGLGEEAVIRVEGRLTENDPAKLQFGQEVELTMVPLFADDDGNEVMTFAFRPVSKGQEGL
ncbi:hypothetical protein BZL29_4161 [Mycobacterium kansasii]|uniref:DUF35 domain-containing protein n=1 Tax=Mycobacterium kansasii TaxID=1768 RepID=A0A1V3X6X9_MYCKA|nr:hypothetical protein BZL29_4161 [Mycobacterium kansasii]